MIRYLISSHVRYAPRTLPRLLPSLLAAGIPRDRILVVVGGHGETFGGQPANYGQTEDGVPHLIVSHNSFDYTGPIAVLENEGRSEWWKDQFEKAEWWFWLHDTCEAGPRFRELVENNFDPAQPITGAAWHSLGMPFANLGIYAPAAFETSRAGLLALKNCTKQQACDGDGVCWRAVHGEEGPWAPVVYPGPGAVGIGSGDPFGTGTTRLRSYLGAVDLYKDQANWGMGGWHVDP